MYYNLSTTGYVICYERQQIKRDLSLTFVVDEGVEHADRIGPTTHTSHHYIREFAGFLEKLGTRFFANDRLEVSKNGGKGDVGMVGKGGDVRKDVVRC